jgi:hypothetical protein
MRARNLSVGGMMLGAALAVVGVLSFVASRTATAVQAAEPKREHWEYALLLSHEDRRGKLTVRTVSWEGPGGETLYAEDFDKFAKKMKLKPKSDTQTALLNELGKDGWELVNLSLGYAIGRAASYFDHAYALRRRK